MITVNQLGLDRVVEIIPKRFSDDRGFFCETYNEARFCEAGITEKFIQDNYSLSLKKGTLRGLHFQAEPMAQAKLVRVAAGSVFDVAVDIRPQSADFGKWVAVELSAEKGNQIFVPAGFAHAFLTLENNTEIVYKVDNPYSKDHDRSIRFDDPLFAIEWPDIGAKFSLSEKDANAPFLNNL